MGKLELRVPQDQDGRFSTELFERYQRSKQALVATLAEIYVHRGSRPGRSRRSPRSCAGTPSRPPPSTNARSIEEARQDLAAWIAKWGARYPKLVSWVEETIEETLTFYRLPCQHADSDEAARL
jgi:transposase-like protein